MVANLLIEPLPCSCCLSPDNGDILPVTARTHLRTTVIQTQARCVIPISCSFPKAASCLINLRIARLRFSLDTDWAFSMRSSQEDVALTLAFGIILSKLDLLPNPGPFLIRVAAVAGRILVR